MFGLLDRLTAQRKRFTQANQARDSACPPGESIDKQYDSILDEDCRDMRRYI